VLHVANEPRFADMPPARIVPMLADEGAYIASESTFAILEAGHSSSPLSVLKIVETFLKVPVALLPRPPGRSVAGP
jgi:hypothetical protein